MEPVTPHSNDQKVNMRLRMGIVSLLSSLSLWKHFHPQRWGLMTPSHLLPRLNYGILGERGSQAVAKPWHVVYSGGKGEHYMFLLRCLIQWLLYFLSATRGQCWFWDLQYSSLVKSGKVFYRPWLQKQGLKSLELRSATAGLNPLLQKKKNFAKARCQLPSPLKWQF